MSDTKQVKQIGQNTAEEFFETILYMTAYTEARSIMQEYTKDIDNPVLKEAIESAMSVAVFGAVFYAVQKQEQIISKIFDVAEALILILYNKGRSLAGKLKGKKGTKLFRFMSWVQGNKSDNIAESHMIATLIGHKSQAHATNGNASNAVGAYQMQTDTKKNIYQRENLHFQFGNAMASRYNETLLFKLFTKSFTANDEMLIKKILGRDTGAVVNVEDLNQVADFMFVKDTNGKITGLSEAFFQLVNSLGYINK
ncbi:MAG: hypothetical protein JW802_05535 [Campylobacterales bacterium]|nr:hypothetical protein [Campylobacterales bacterium]MBN2832577.1 hypothetical protein [Campylobacterales bacterium]